MLFELNTLPHSQDIIKNAVSVYKKANIYQYSNREKYIQYLNDFYRDEIVRRVELAQNVQGSLDLQSGILNLVSRREHFVDWMVDWCWTYDPRNSERGLPTSIPWIPWPQQIKFIEWFYNQYLNGKGGLIEKSRDAGVTWLVGSIFIREWRWEKGFSGGIGSRKESLVDEKDEPDSIFVKLRQLLSMLPKWWMPKGFDYKKHDKFCNLINPDMTSQIGGEAGDNIGRGGRRSVYLVDEAAFLAHPKSVDASLSQNTNCQFDLSTPNGMNNFGKKRHSGRVDVFSFHWKSDVRKDENWYKVQLDKFDPVIVAQEIDCDYQASVEGIFIEPKWIESAIDLDLPEKGIRSAGLDVGAEGKNNSALAVRCGSVAKVREWKIPNGIDLAHKAIEEGNKHGVDYMNYDKIGVGHAMYSAVNRTETHIKFKHYGVVAGESPSDKFYPEFNATGKETFLNSRSEWWYNLACRFEKTYEHVNDIKKYDLGELISIENDRDLISQLSAPKKMRTTSGKIKCESKIDMKKRDIESPDMADAMVMAFIPQDAGKKHVFPGYNSVIGGHFREIEIDWKYTPLNKHLHYASFYQAKDNTVYLIASIFNQVEGVLFVYKEMVIDNLIPSIIVPRLTDMFKLNTLEFHKFLANDKMFGDNKNSLARKFKIEFRKHIKEQDVKLRLPNKFNREGSIAIVNELILRNKIFVSDKCPETNTQLSTWSYEKKQEFGFCEGLMMIGSELKEEKTLKQILKGVEYTTMENYEDVPVIEYKDIGPASPN